MPAITVDVLPAARGDCIWIECERLGNPLGDSCSTVVCRPPTRYSANAWPGRRLSDEAKFPVLSGQTRARRQKSLALCNSNFLRFGVPATVSGLATCLTLFPLTSSPSSVPAGR